MDDVPELWRPDHRLNNEGSTYALSLHGHRVIWKSLQILCKSLNVTWEPLAYRTSSSKRKEFSTSTMDNQWHKDREWRKTIGKDQYLISTAIDLLDHEFINTAFGTEDMYWANSLSPELIKALLAKSTTLGVYQGKNLGKSSLPQALHPY